MEDRRLREAALEGSVPSLLELLQNDPLILDRVIVDCVAETPLHIAAMLGHVNFARELIFRKPELAREFDQRRQYPLHLASAKGYVEIVKLLLLIAPEICLARDQNGKTPLQLAAMKGQVEVLKELVLASPDEIRERGDCGQTILYLCVKHDRLEPLKLLCDLVDDDFVNSKDDDGNTVLHFAVAEKQIEAYIGCFTQHKILIHFHFNKVVVKTVQAVTFLLGRPGVEVNSLNANSFTALDVLMQSHQRNLKDYIGEVLQNAGALRSRDISPAAGQNGSIAASSSRPVATHHTVIAQRPSSQVNSWENYLEKHDDWLEKKKSSLMVVASLIATMSFQTGISPPGGVWPDNAPFTSNNTDGHNVGSSVMAEKYTEFVGLNTTAFVASLSIILLLMSGLPLKRMVFMWVLMVIMWIAIISTALTYLLSVLILTPRQVQASMSLVMIASILVWSILMILLLVAHTIRLLLKLLGKFRRVRSEPSN